VRVELEEAYEVVVAGSGDADVFITCEHASARLVEPWEWPEGDRWAVGTHWAYDIGAADLTRELTAALGTVAVLSRFSRLLVDPNRDMDAPDLFRSRADGRAIALNTGLSPEERELRLARLYRPFHSAIDRELEHHRASVVLAVHTFTPSYEGTLRELEVGVLFDEEEELALRLSAAFAKTGLITRLNEPYSGKEGVLYSAHRHARAKSRRAIEIEVRQDLAVEEVIRKKLVEALHAELG
jgi:predicted N-formylglutamate amidohydrolase